MEPAADPPVPEGEEDGERKPRPEGPLSFARGLRFFESVAFCCLAAVVILWAFDRSRDIGFDPVTVQICEGPACTPTPEASDQRAWTQYTQTLDLLEITVFSSTNTCAFAADLLRSRATQDGVDLALDLMQSRGTISVTVPGDGTAIIAPGRNNDGMWDVVRDAFRWQGTRGCHPMHYAPVFWPIWTIWMLLINWRLFRYARSASNNG